MNGLMDFDMDVFGGLEFWNLMEGDFSGWEAGVR
jgi:hypothetical protein